LRRTEGATRQKAFSLGLSLETRAGKISPKWPDKLNKEIGPVCPF